MSASLEIHPLSDLLEFHGHPDPSSAYSLAGHVSISLSSTSSFFEQNRALRLLLHSLTITFEGQTELVTTETGYSGLRLCSITRELAPAELIELSNEGQEDSGNPCVWNVTFNIQVPGWLPSSDIFGDTSQDDTSGTSYALYATAKFTTIADGSTGESWLLSTLCAPFRSKSRIVTAPPKPIFVQRIMPIPSMPSTSTSAFPFSVFTATASSDETIEQDSSCVPPNVLAGIQVTVSVPCHIDVDDPSFPLILRLRTQDLSVEDRKKLRLVDFFADVEQVEKYRTSPPSEYRTQLPLPPDSLQPPNVPLRSTHPLGALYDLGFAIDGPRHSASRSFSLLSQEHSGHYSLAADGYVFSDRDTGVDSEPCSKWFGTRAEVPLGLADEIKEARDWAGPKKLRQTEQGPLFHVQHKLHLSLTYTYDLEDLTDATGPKRAETSVQFSIPLDFVRVDPRITRCLTPPLSSASSASSSTTSLASHMSSLPYASPLPPYSQLYDSNGDRKIDYSIPLPLYTPRSPTSSCFPEVEDLPCKNTELL